jgi:WD40 repeat protein
MMTLALAFVAVMAGPEIVTLPHPVRTANLTYLQYSPDGKRLLASGYPSGIVQVFDVPSAKELHRFKGPSGFRGTSEYCRASADFSKVYVADCFRSVEEFEVNGKKVNRVVFDGGIRGWNGNDGKELKPFGPTHSTHGTAVLYLSTDGRHAIAVEQPSYIPPVDLPQETYLWTINTAKSERIATAYSMAAFSNDSKLLALAVFNSKDQPSELSVRNLADSKVLWRLKSEVASRGFSIPIFSNDASQLLVQESPGLINQPAKLQTFEASTGKPLLSIDSEGPFPFMNPAWSPDGRWIASGDYAGQVRIWDAALGKVKIEKKFENSRCGRSCAFSPDSKRLFTLVQENTNPILGGIDPKPELLPPPRFLTITLGEKPSFEEITLPRSFIGGVAVRPDGKQVAVGIAGAVLLVPVTP